MAQEEEENVQYYETDKEAAIVKKIR